MYSSVFSYHMHDSSLLIRENNLLTYLKIQRKHVVELFLFLRVLGDHVWKESQLQSLRNRHGMYA